MVFYSWVCERVMWRFDKQNFLALVQPWESGDEDHRLIWVKSSGDGSVLSTTGLLANKE